MKHVIMEVGGRRFTGQDVEYIQENVRELVAALVNQLSDQADSNIPLVLYGINFVDTGTTITASAGWIFWQGELYEFVPPPAPIAQTGLTNVKLYRTDQSDGELAYKDAEDIRTIRSKKFITLDSSSWVNANVDAGDRILIADLARMGPSPWEELLVGGLLPSQGPNFGASETFQMRTKLGRAEVYGTIVGTGITPADNSLLICILPAKYRPSRTIFFYEGEHKFSVLPNGDFRYVNRSGGPTGIFVNLTNTSFSID